MLTTQLGFEIGLNSVLFYGTLLILLVTLSGLVAQIVIEITIMFYNMFRSALQVSIGDGGMTGSGDIVFRMLQDNAVQKIFFALLAVALILLILSTIIKSITTEFNFQQGGNAKSKIFFSAIKALALFVVVPVVSILAIGLANWLLGAILKAIEGSAGLQSFDEILNNAFGISGGGGGGSYFDIISNLIVIGLVWSIAKKFWGAIIGIVLRMYELTTLFIISTPIIGVMPLTENPYKKWISAFTSRVLGLFGLVLSVNLCVLLISVANRLGVTELFKSGSEQMSFICKMFVHYAIIIGGLSMIDSISKLIADAVGGMDYLSAGTSAGKEALSAIGAGVKRFTPAAAAAATLGPTLKNRQKAIKEARANKGLKDAKGKLTAAENAANEAEKNKQKALEELNKATAEAVNDPDNKEKAKALKEKAKAYNDAEKESEAADKKLADARRSVKYAEKGMNVSKSQQGMIDELNSLNEKMKNAKTPEEKEDIANQMQDKFKELKATGVDVGRLQKAAGFNFRGKFGGVGAIDQDALDDELGNINNHGVLVGKGKARKQIIELQADTEARLKGNKDKVNDAREQIDRDLSNITDAEKAITDANKQFSDGSITQEERDRIVKEKGKTIENARMSIDLQNGVIRTTNSQIKRDESFIRRTELLKTAPSMVSSVMQFAKVLSPITEISNSQFGKEFTEVVKSASGNIGSIPSVEPHVWFSTNPERMQAQFADIAARTKAAVDIAAERSKEGIDEELGKISETIAAQKKRMEADIDRQLKTIGDSISSQITGLQNFDYSQITADADSRVTLANAALSRANTRMITGNGTQAQIDAAQAEVDAAMREQLEMQKEVARQKAENAREIARLEAERERKEKELENERIKNVAELEAQEEKEKEAARKASKEKIKGYEKEAAEAAKKAKAPSGGAGGKK